MLILTAAEFGNSAEQVLTNCKLLYPSASDRWFVRTGWFLCSLVSLMSVGRKHDNLDDIFKDIVDEAVLLRDSAAP